MADLDLAALDIDLLRDEGERMTLYKDSRGIDTIGRGHKCTPEEVAAFRDGITQEKSIQLYTDDRDFAIYQLDNRLDWWRGLHADAMLGLANQCFELGFRGLSEFTHMLAALERGDYAGAADEALASKWSEQVPKRAARVAALYRGCTST